MSRLIAIIKDRQLSTYDDDGYNAPRKIVDSITDWEMVEESDYQTLRAAAHSMGFTILEKVSDTKEFIGRTIAEYRAEVQRQASELLAKKKAKDDAALQKKLTKELKTKASKLAMLKRLQEELGNDPS